MASFDCVYCRRPFSRVHTCLRHLRRGHRGHPATYETRLLQARRPGHETSMPTCAAEGGSSGPAASAPPASADGDETTTAYDAGLWASSYAASLGHSSISSRVTELYEDYQDVSSSSPSYASSGALPTRCTSPFLRQVLHHVTLSTRTGHPQYACQDLWRLLTSTPGGGAAPPMSAAAEMQASFTSQTSLSEAVNHERQRLDHLAGWRETSMSSSSGEYPLGYRGGLPRLLEGLINCPVKHIFSPGASGVPSELVGPSRGAIFDAYEAEVRQSHGDRAFVLPLTAFSDATTLPNSGAVTTHPLRLACEIRPPGAARVFVSVGALPQVFAQLGPGGADRARVGCRELFQRSLFVVLRDVIQASHDGVDVEFGGKLGVWRAFPRLGCYSADFPEKRAALCLRGVGCAHPCCTCIAELSVACSAGGLRAPQRDVVGTVTDMLVAHALSTSDIRGSSAERDCLCHLHSCKPLPPALAAMAGLGTPPYMLFKVFGLGTLHVR